MPKVSIILPTHNRSNLLPLAIDSCLNQTFHDFELIVVNDCSTDDTAKILDGYAAKDSRVKIISNEVNLRLPASLNKGFASAIGKYYTWTSDDNLYKPTALETMVSELDENPALGLVYAPCELIDDEGKTIGDFKLNDVNDGFMEWRGCGACFLYRAEIQELNRGYDTSLFLIEDYDFFVRAWLKAEFKFLKNNKLYQYRHHADSLTSLNANAIYELVKIRIEKLQPILFHKFSHRDKILFFRKYAVYYSVMKNNVARMNLYLGRLWINNKKQYLLTVVYIMALKIKSVFAVGFGILAGLFQAKRF